MAAPQRWEFIPVLPTASKGGSSKQLLAWDGMIVIASQVGCEDIHCFFAGAQTKHAHPVRAAWCLHHIPAQHQHRISHKKKPFLPVLNNMGVYDPLCQQCMLMLGHNGDFEQI